MRDVILWFCIECYIVHSIIRESVVCFCLVSYYFYIQYMYVAVR